MYQCNQCNQWRQLGAGTTATAPSRWRQLVKAQLTCKHHPDPQSIDAELLGVDRKEGEDGGGRGEEEEEVELDGEQPGVDTQTRHLDQSQISSGYSWPITGQYLINLTNHSSVLLDVEQPVLPW